METTQQALCPTCERPLPRTGAVCRYCRDRSPAGLHVRPLFLALVLILAAAFGAATVFANRFYQVKQKQLGQMWFGRGQAALAAAQPQPAIQAFRNALYYSHDDPAYRLRLAEALVAANRIPEAQSYLLTLWQDEPSNSTVNLQLARLAAKQGETQRALRYYHGAIYGLWPDGNVAERQQTRLELIHYLLGLHDSNQADGELIALAPELPRTALAHTQVGALFLQAGDQEHALQEFTEALRLNPKQPAALRGAGEAAFQLGRYLQATRYLDRARRAEPLDSKSEKLLATSRLVLEWNPYAKGLNPRQQAARIVQAFTQARRRLNQCAALRGISLTPALQTPAAPATPAPPSTPQNNHAPGLVAKILSSIKPGENGNSLAGPAPGNSNPSAMQQLQQQVTQLRRDMRPNKLERDPQLADSAMGLVTQIETVTAQQCGAPKGPDLALLLLAHQAEDR
ncbi:MAG: tetratricopeptide repeat protein [Chlamydiota bacterium]